MNRPENGRPRCPKCGGMLIPEKAFSGDGDTLVTVSVGCVNCGERWFRAHQRRRPAGAELNAHLQAGRPAHLVPGGKRV